MKPDPKHIAAVQDGISGWPIGTGYYATQVGTDEAWDIATGLLTSTDPAVLDAMQDALVRAGRLTEEEATRPKWEVCTDPSHNHLIFGSGGAISHVSEWVTVRRALTDWREVDR